MPYQIRKPNPNHQWSWELPEKTKPPSLYGQSSRGGPFESAQRLRQTVDPTADRTCPKADNHITWTGLFGNKPREVLRAVNSARMAMTVLDQPSHQCVAVSAFNRLFARSVNIRNSDNIAVVKAGTELIEVVAQAL